MNATQTMKTQTLLPQRMVHIAVALALIASLSYVLIANDLLPVGSLTGGEGPAGIVYTAAGCYLAGGLLILARRRWLLIIGAAINALVVLFFVRMYTDRLDVMFSPGGLVSKIAQILLETALVYLIITFKKSATDKRR